MGIVRKSVELLKVQEPEEYAKLMKGYKSENDLIKDLLGLAINSYDSYISGKGGTYNG